MTDAKTDAGKKSEQKKVKLTAYHGENGPGDVVTLDKADADRLVEIGAAAEVKATSGDSENAGEQA